MTDVAASPARTIALQHLGDPNAIACEGDVCDIPAHPAHVGVSGEAG